MSELPVAPVAVGRIEYLVNRAPGDDTGTLTIYDDGTAYWVSDNGDLDTWLTTDEITYEWVC